MVVLGRRRVPRLPPLRPLLGPGGRGGVRRRLLDRAAGQRGPPGGPSGLHPGRGRHLRVASRSTAPVAGVFHLASPASPPDYLARPLETLAVGSEGTRRGLELARAARGPLPDGLHQRGLRRSRRPPPARGVLGKRQPGRAPQRLRRGQAVRRGADHGPPPHARDRRRPSPGSSTPTVPGSGPTTAGWSPTSCSRPCGASRSPSTATAARPGASATWRTRCGGWWPCSTPTLTGPVNIGNPDEYTVLELARTVVDLLGSTRRRSCTGPCRPTTPPAAGRTSPWPGPSWAGSRPPSCRTGSAPTAAYLAEEAGTAGSVPAGLPSRARLEAATLRGPDPTSTEAGERGARTHG